METEKTTSSSKLKDTKSASTKKGAARAAEILGAAAVGSASTMAANADWSEEDEHQEQEVKQSQDAKPEETAGQVKEEEFNPDDIIIDDSAEFGTENDVVVESYDVDIVENVDPEPITFDVNEEEFIVVDVEPSDIYCVEDFNPDDIQLDDVLEYDIEPDVYLADSDTTDDSTDFLNDIMA